MSKPMVVAFSGALLLGLATSPALADNFAFGFSYGSGYGYCEPVYAAPVYGGYCGTAYVAPSYYCPPPVVIVDRPRYYTTPRYRGGYYYGHDRPRTISGGFANIGGFRAGNFNYQGHSRSFGIRGIQGPRGGRAGQFYYQGR
ncbi:MAG: hypothetical protein LC135_01430 [Phycisphaerae bacterium]|jgi:hypothetical protein|nr:hypothetical protein [Phycisphaerae bacterium]MCZ2398514.1 hypothetical protein [Phycisphaerae bacterium]NUQ50298.1 hypothetical protein [Phycisphaerae bacterium]